jgi:hypothetical protein
MTVVIGMDLDMNVRDAGVRLNRNLDAGFVEIVAAIRD